MNLEFRQELLKQQLEWWGAGRQLNMFFQGPRFVLDDVLLGTPYITRVITTITILFNEGIL